ncbi:nickel/cobalt transporter [Kiloniella sp. b19]|uniref:nickel/cobalt transporter n=1 Tax=Kiloniella sp. GXU_MW_B19 TaxID=3141326 RepID=UPI0031DA2910
MKRVLPLLCAALLLAAPKAAFAFEVLSAFQETWAGLIDITRAYQQSFSAEISSAVRAMATEGLGGNAAWHMAWVSFLYGVFHAVGPGHGKAIISSYSLTHHVSVRKTASLAMISSCVQGLTAIVIVGGAWLILEGGVRSFSLSVEDALEPVSYGAFIAVGVFLMFRGFRNSEGHHHCCGHDHGHSHDHAHSGCDHNHGHQDEHAHHEHHDHSRQSKHEIRKRDFWLLISSVGIRPCTGALLVLILSFLLGEWWGGLMAVLAMSLGTGLTVSAIALTAKGIRVPLLWLVEDIGGNRLWVGRVIPVLGGGVIALFGGALLYDYWITPAHPFV